MEHSRSLLDVNCAQSKHHQFRRMSSDLCPEAVSLKTSAAGQTHSSCGQDKLREQLSSEFFRYDLRGEFPEFFVRKAERELRETPENRENALRELKELIGKNGEDFKTDDFFLLMFLRVKKFDPLGAFRRIQDFYQFKREVYDGCKPFDVPQLRQELSTKVYTILPYRDHLGRGIFLVRMGLFNPDIITFKELLALSALSGVATLDNPINQVTGFVGIIDFADISLRWLRHCGIQNVKPFLFLCFGAIPVRFQKMHFVNENFIFKPIFQVVQMLATEKIKERIFFHGRSMQSLHKHISPVLLPPEYGGTLQEEEIIPDAARIVGNQAFN